MPFYPGHETTVAYKGGHYEKDLLKKLDISSVNLEELGCPKVDEIMSMYKRHDFTMARCRIHSHGHCPMEEVGWMEFWLRKNARKNGVSIKHQPWKNPIEHLSLDYFAVKKTYF